MKVELRKHISEILSSLQIPICFEVYDCNNDILPEWTEQIQLTHEFLVCCEEIVEVKRLQSFLGKPIFKIGNHIYWFDGNRIIAEGSTELESLIALTEQHIEWLKTKTALPAWLDDIIFDHLKAEYAPDFRRFDYNLELTKEDNLKYLGTYFPRSYTESFCIFDNIFQNAIFQKTFFEKKSLNILSVGCGTGGDLMGLLVIIEKYCHFTSEVKIWAIDGNGEALEILKELIQKFRSQTSKRIELHIIKNIFSSIHDINTHQIKELIFDFILSFKMICEIISAGKGDCDNSYYDFVMKFIPMLSENGLCVLLDVTTKTEHNNTYNPILKNSQVNQALRELKGYKTLLPLSCSQNENDCTEQCFTQQKFYVSHKGKINDISKVSYRVISKATFVEELVDGNKKAKYVLQRSGQFIDKFCPHSNGERILDSFKLIN